MNNSESMSLLKKIKNYFTVLLVILITMYNYQPINDFITYILKYYYYIYIKTLYYIY